MSENDLTEIRLWLALHHGEWPDFARDAGLPYSTLEKVARGTTKNPRYETYNKLRDEWLKRTRRYAHEVINDSLREQ